MRDFIILNGKNSTTLNGLIISNLPPITKPSIRTNIETIDGRDGDIITKLGYSAYDKEFEIGLSYNYNLDDIITYFNSEGIVTFSNEIDKYYLYTIVDAIDFEKLIRFKTAKVKMHIQPFKYSTVETIKSFDITNETSITIRNNGNYVSRPIIKITGSGTINLSLNDHQIFVLELGEGMTMTIDTNLMSAYNETALLNRLVTGDYDKFMLNIGPNTISWSGTITKIELQNYSRWI